MATVDLEIRKAPLPDGLDPANADGRRAWQRRLADQQVLHEGGLSPELVVVQSDATQLLVPLEGFVGDRVHHAAALALQLVARPETVCVFRRGEVVRTVDGAPRREACVLELRAEVDGQRAWIARRQVGMGEGGTGTLMGEWTLEEPEPDDLHPDLQAWIDPGDAAVDIQEGEAVDTPAPEIEMELILRGEAPVPEDAAGYADEVGMLTDAGVVEKGLPWLLVYAFRDDCIEEWRVRGELPCSLDDLVRNVAAFSAPEAIALVAPGVVTCPDGVNRRGAFTLVEHQGHRYERVLPLHVAADGSRSAPHALCRDRDDPEPADRWLGVTPGFDLQLQVNPSRSGAPVAES